MKRLALPLLLGLSLAGGCDSPAGSGGPVVLVVVLPDERVLARGETLQLETTVRDRGGEEPPEARMAEMAWSSDAPAVATVAGGLVTAVAPGTATIRAELEGVAGTVRVHVADAAASCDEAGAVAQLAVGGAVTLSGVEASLLCLEGGATGRDYVAVPFHAGPAGAFAPVHLRAEGTVPPGPLAAAAPAPARLAEEPSAPRPDHGFHLRLRERAARELAPLVDAVRAGGEPDAAAPRFALQLSNPRVGQEVRVNTSLAACDSASMRTARVAAVGARSVVLADLSNPSGGLTNAEYASFAAGFDTLVWPTITGSFGEPRDLDGNERVVIFYTRAVNELTPPGSSAYVGGYFHARDLFPTRARSGVDGCATSNVAEMFYMLVPDPTGSVNGTPFSRALVLERSLGTIAHEFQHLISASRRLYVVETSHWNEEVWLNEGLSHVAEELVFHRAAGTAPRANLASDALASGRAGSAFRSYQEENFRRLERFLGQVETESPYDAAAGDADDLATRGAGWSFLRYAADRRSGSDDALWKALVDGTTTGTANLAQALGADPHPWMRDWLVSLYTDDFVSGAASRHVQPSWLLRSFWNGYPLRVHTLAANGTLLLTAKAGSGAFVRFGVPAAGTAVLRAGSAADLPLPSAVSVTIVRTR